MWKIAAVTAAATLGASALAAAEGPQPRLAAGEVAEAVEGKLKICVGPTRLIFGGAPAVTVRFGGEGCGRGREGLLGFAVERGAAAAVRELIA